MFELDFPKKSQEIQEWIAKTVQDAGFQKVIIAVSGGVDSATSLFLAVQALGVGNVYAVLLPYGEMSSTSLEHGQLAVEKAGLPKGNVFVRDIKPGVDKLLEQAEDPDDIRKGNIMARKQLQVLVVGTENKSEHYLGYFTRFGDEASDIEPIRSLYKTQVWELAKYLGVPQEIVGKAPSAGLWEGQSDEGEFGFSYLEADKILSLGFDEGMTNGSIVASGIDEKVVKKVMGFVDKNNFKHDLPKIFDK